MPDAHADLRACDASSSEGILRVVIRKEFDFGHLHQDWAHGIITMNVGPYRAIRIDMAACGLVSSTFFAGVIQLRRHYCTEDNGCRITLVKPDARVVRSLKVLQFDTLFDVEPR
jgi:hypothetical protein